MMFLSNRFPRISLFFFPSTIRLSCARNLSLRSLISFFIFSMRSLWFSHFFIMFFLAFQSFLFYVFNIRWELLFAAEKNQILAYYSLLEINFDLSIVSARSRSTFAISSPLINIFSCHSFITFLINSMRSFEFIEFD